MNRIFIPFLFIACLFLINCNDDESRFSSSQIQQALFNMKGTYHGAVEVVYYQGSKITELPEAVAVSRDSLSFTMSLIPMADVISDESISKIMREVEEVTVKAGYDFLQMDDDNLHFILEPMNIVVSGDNINPPVVEIVFSQYFGGDVQISSNFMMFNISPTELWINGEKYEDFKQLVYHFKGVYE